MPHPVREGDVAFEQLLRVAAAAEPFPLGMLTDVEQADGDVDQRSGQHLTGRHRIARHQQVPACFVEPYRSKHGLLGHPLAPLERRGIGHRTEVAQLDRRHGRSEVGGDRLPTDVLPAQLAPEIRSSTASIIAAPATDLAPRTVPTP